MVVKSLSLETVCGITSRLPENSCLRWLLPGSRMWGNHRLSMRSSIERALQELRQSRARHRQSISTM